MAARVKVIDLAKELGVTSKDLIVALEGMGHKGMRAMSPLLVATANELRVKLGRGRDLPAETKPKRAAKPKAAEGAAPATAPKKRAVGAKKSAAKSVEETPEVIELAPAPALDAVKPAATIFRPAPSAIPPAAPSEIVPIPPVVPAAASIAPPAAAPPGPRPAGSRAGRPGRGSPPASEARAPVRPRAVTAAR